MKKLAVGALGVALVLACTPQGPATEQPSSQPEVHAAAGDTLLSRAGFALEEPATNAPVTGHITASFQAPVVDQALESPPTAGNASITVDGMQRAVQAYAVVEALSDGSVAYAVLQDPTIQDRLVLVAVDAALAVPGASLALDGVAATVLVVDSQSGGTARLAASGTLWVDAASLLVGGTFQGHLEDAALVDVTLSTWPEHLLPLGASNAPHERLAVAAQGTFEAIWREGGHVPGEGTANIPVELAGAPAFVATHASAIQAASRDGSDAEFILILGSEDASQVVQVVLPASLAVAGSSVTLGGLSSAALVSRADGTAILAAVGTLTFTAVNATEGGLVTGSITLSGDGYVLTCEETGACSSPPDNPDLPACSADQLAALPGLLAVDEVGVATSEQLGGQLPSGFGSVVVLWDGSQEAGLAVLIPAAANLAAGVTVDLAPVDVEGRPVDVAQLYLANCDGQATVQGGTLTIQPVEAGATRLTGSITFTVAGEDHTLSVDAPLSPLEG